MSLFVDASFWLLVSFLILVGGLVGLKVPVYVLRALDGWREQVAVELGEAEMRREEALEALEEARVVLAEAPKEGERLLEEARVGVDAYVRVAREGMEEVGVRRMRAARRQVERALSGARGEVAGEIVDVAVGAARVLIVRGKTQTSAGVLKAVEQASVKLA